MFSNSILQSELSIFIILCIPVIYPSSLSVVLSKSFIDARSIIFISWKFVVLSTTNKMLEPLIYLELWFLKKSSIFWHPALKYSKASLFISSFPLDFKIFVNIPGICSSVTFSCGLYSFYIILPSSSFMIYPVTLNPSLTDVVAASFYYTFSAFFELNVIDEVPIFKSRIDEFGLPFRRLSILILSKGFPSADIVSPISSTFP